MKQQQEAQVVHDEMIEWFIGDLVGAKWDYDPKLPLASIKARGSDQFSRMVLRDENYVAGIKESAQLGAPMRPVIVARHSGTGGVLLLDGYHRVEAVRTRQETLAAYVVVDPSPEQEMFVATTANVLLNGQGLSEEERRRHFLAALRATFGELSAVVLRKPYAVRLGHVLSIARTTARKLVEVEVFLARAAALGLKVPEFREQTHNHAKGARGEMWVLTVSQLTDEELLEYWPRLVTAHPGRLKKAVLALKRHTSSQKRKEAAKELLGGLLLNVHVMSQSIADQERRAAQQIRSHGAALVKLAPQFAKLAAKYEDVERMLNALGIALLDYVTAPGGGDDGIQARDEAAS